MNTRGRAKPGGPRRARRIGPGAAAVALAAAAATTLGAAPRVAAADPATCTGGPAVTPTDPATASSTTADLDGDGVRQPVTLARRTDVGGQWLLSTRAPGGGVLNGSVPDSHTAEPWHLSGPADMDGDGDEEVVLRAAAGASTDIVGIWAVDACDWRPVTIGGSYEIAGFFVGASVMHGDGVRCTYGERSEVRRYQSRRIDDTDRHRVTVQTYTWSGLHLTGAGAEETLEVSDAELATRFPADFACGHPTPARDVPPTTAAAKAATAARPVPAQPRFTG